jgi:acetyl-CoA carboxylase carboxyl transferase subunit alpha
VGFCGIIGRYGRYENDFLDFEQPIAELEAKIEELRFAQDSALDISEDRAPAEEEPGADQGNLRQAERVADRAGGASAAAHTLDYVNTIFTDFEELHGDRVFADDTAIVGGLARFNGETCVVIGQQKGRDTKEKIFRNFGMPKPEGYRKALRLMRLAERFNVPVFTFVDTPGAYPGVGAEERGQSEAIGRNLFAMAELRVPIICTIIGEGGSGGALAIAIGDVVIMLQYSTYSVISPEGCASILWKSADFAAEAAETLGITATRLKALGLIDKIVGEPLGGAHRDYDATMQAVKKALQDSWRQLKDIPLDKLLETRFEKLIGYGKFKEVEQK